MSDFVLGRLGPKNWPVFRLGLAATYRPGERTVRCALDHGVNYLFAFAIDTNITGVVRGMNADQRENVVLATGGYNWIFGHTSLKKSLENALRRYKTDYIDVFHFLGVMKPKEFPPRMQEDLSALRADGKVRATAISCHHRKFAGELAAHGAVDALMIRYNAAHPGAEADIFPHVAAHNTGVISYTATRWGRLLVRPRGWPESEPVATAGQCYRFVLSHPNVQVALTAPSNERQLLENLRELERGPLPEDEMAFPSALRRSCARPRRMVHGAVTSPAPQLVLPCFSRITRHSETGIRLLIRRSLGTPSWNPPPTSFPLPSAARSFAPGVVLAAASPFVSARWPSDTGRRFAAESDF